MPDSLGLRSLKSVSPFSVGERNGGEKAMLEYKKITSVVSSRIVLTCLFDQGYKGNEKTPSVAGGYQENGLVQAVRCAARYAFHASASKRRMSIPDYFVVTSDSIGREWRAIVKHIERFDLF